MSSEVDIKVERLSKCYQIYDKPRDRLLQGVVPRLQRMLGRSPKQYFREFWALKDVSLEVKRGETVGIIGRNGSGKSTLLQLICGTLNPTSGTIKTNGRIAALLELGSGFSPEFTGRENIYMNAAVIGLSADEIKSRFSDITAFADIGNFIDQPVNTYSSGMVVRLAFAVAINVHPQILVIDEALAVGDAAFQRKCMRKIEELSQAGVTMLFVSHNTETVKKICSSSIYLDRGIIRSMGTAKEVCTEYDRDLFGASKGREENSTAQHGDTIIASPQMDIELLNCCEKVYGDDRASILDITLTDIAQNKINVLPARSEFIISYRARFLETVTNPILGMMITNREGLCVFGTNTKGIPIFRRDYMPGDEIQVSFILTNNLSSGIYYLTCGVHACDSEEGIIFLQRRMDTLMLKSLALDSEAVSGTANLYPQIKYSFNK